MMASGVIQSKHTVCGLRQQYFSHIHHDFSCVCVCSCDQ